jgi:hypothetical protein
VRGVALIVAVLALSASASGAGGSGLYGKVMRGPVTPVCVAERPCSRPAAGARLQFVRSGVVVGRVAAAPDGRYRVVLPAGRYLVRTGVRAGRIEPASVRVLAAHWLRRDFSIDTGIR